MTKLNQDGSHLIVVLLAVVVIAAVGLVGYKVINHGSSATQADSQLTALPAAITNTANLKDTAKALTTSSKAVDNSLNSDSLNSNLNDLL